MARVNAFADHAAFTAYGDTRWLDPGAALPSGEDWQRSDVPPQPGTERLVEFILPASADLTAPFWALFEPTIAADDGWSDHPETIDASAFVRCRMIAVARAGTPGRKASWLKIAVEEIVLLSTLAQRLPAQPIARLETWELGTGWLTRHGGWELMFAPHDDAGCWLLAQHRAGDADIHIVAAGEWVWGYQASDLAWAGHVVVATAEWDRIYRSLCRGR